MALLSPGRARATLRGALMALALLAPSARARPEDPGRPPTEREVQAAFLLNFTSFVTWPEGALAEDRFVVGILGRDPFGETIDRFVEGERAPGSRAIEVRRIDSVEEAAECDLVFIPSSESRRIDSTLNVLRGRPILTVGDSRGFAGHGGMIEFRIVENRVRFEINLDAARLAGLSISSHLLKLALRVHETGAVLPETR